MDDLLLRLSPARLWGAMATDPLPAVQRDRFLDAMSRAATGVTVVTSHGSRGRFGQTVSAMSSVSADPPLLLVCINRKSPIHAAIHEHRTFGVNVLRADQRRLSDVFAGRPQRDAPYDFTIAAWDEGATGSPLLIGAVARFDCTLDAAHEAGTHTIFVGQVVGADAGAGQPLVYAGRGYGELHAFPHRGETDELLYADVEAEPREL